MAKKKRRKRADHSRNGDRPRVVRRNVERPSVQAEEQPLIRLLKRALYGDHPLDLLAEMSTLMAATEPSSPWGGDGDRRIDLAELTETFLESDFAPITAALHVMATYTQDELLARRIRSELANRRQPMPAWLRDLSKTEVVAVHQIAEPFRDGEDYMLDVRLPDGYRMTAIVYVDNNLGEIVKDGLAVPVPLETVAAEYFADTAFSVTAVDAADARARIEQALALGEITVPPLESETWPTARPLVRWLVSLLPEGGEVAEPMEWTDEMRADLIEDFVRSSHGAGYDDPDHRDQLSSLLWFGIDYSGGDPLRWSPVNVEILLTDWFPRKVVAEASYLAKLPELLRAFIRYSHDAKEIPARLTSEVLGAVDRWELTYREAIESGPQGTAGLVQELLASGGLDDVLGIPPANELVDLVGGPEELAALDRRPLPDEPFDWDGVPEDISAKVGSILEHCDRAADQLLDVEHRTAQRRLLRDVVLAEPGYFRGRAAAHTSAAAISWLVAHANDTATPYGPLTMGELMGEYGVKSAGDRPHRFRAMLDLPEHQPWMGPDALGSQRYLVAARREELIAERDRIG